MEPFKKALNTLKYLIEETAIAVVKDLFTIEDDGSDARLTNAIMEIYASEGVPVEERYDIRINGKYHRLFLEELEGAFDDLDTELSRNLNLELVADKIPAYLEELRKELVTWNNRIVEHEIQINNKKYWIYLDIKINRGFLESEGITESILTNISDIFLYQKNRAIGFLVRINNEANNENKKESSESYIDPGVEDLDEDLVLDIRQTALLFHYLKKHKAIQNHSNKNLAELIHPLTGYSAQTLRTTQGFGVIHSIMEDKSKSIKYSDYPDHNLDMVKDLLNKILDDMRGQKEKNKRNRR